MFSRPMRYAVPITLAGTRGHITLWCWVCRSECLRSGALVHPRLQRPRPPEATPQSMEAVVMLYVIVFYLGFGIGWSICSLMVIAKDADRHLEVRTHDKETLRKVREAIGNPCQQKAVLEHKVCMPIKSGGSNYPQDRKVIRP